MTLLAVDPSSTRTGYAVMPSYSKILEAGCLMPKSRDAAIDRVRSQCDDLAGLVADYKVTGAVIEITSGRPGTGSRRGARATLGVYGMAVGAMVCELWHLLGRARVTEVDEQTWTHCLPKEQRRRSIAMQFPHYAKEVFAGKDRGGDVSDAIGLGLWYFMQKRRTQ